MTQNPYAQFGSGDGTPTPYGPEFGDQPQARTSVLAIISLVLSVIGCVCFIIPGPGALAMAIGGIAILLIMASHGRVRGIGFAATAVCLGLLQTIVFFVILLGVYQPIMGGWNNTVVAPVNDVLVALEKKDAKAARALLTPRAQAAISEEMLTEFAAKYQARLGAYKGVPENPLDIWTAYKSIAPAMKVMQNGPGGNPQQNMIPLPGTFERGNALIILQLDNAGFNGQRPPASTTIRMPVLNIGIASNDGTEIWILDLTKASTLPRKKKPGRADESTIEDAPDPKPEPTAPPAPASPPSTP